MKSEQHPLRRWRTRQGFSLRRLSGLLRDEVDLDISHVSLGRIERGHQDPSFALLLALLRLSGGRLALAHWVPAAIAALAREQVKAKKENGHAVAKLGRGGVVALGAKDRLEA